MSLPLLEGQPYPRLPAWEDLSVVLANRWQITQTIEYLCGFSGENTATIMGRLRIGSDRVIGPLPDTYLPAGQQASPTAAVRGIGPAEVEVWNSGNLVLPHYVVDPSRRTEFYTGETFVFTITYPRRKS